MSTERIDIVVSENGSRTVKRNLDDLGRSGSQAAGGVNLLQKALIGLSVGVGLTFLVRQADAYTNLLNRLKLVTTSSENLRVVNDALFASANRTRSAYEATAGLYGNLARASKELGLGQADLLAITETVNQAIAVSGTDATTAANGLRQLGQGLASGALRGDELNSVLENMPRLAEAIADGMGITVGQLRAMGAEGKISGKAITDALKGQADVIAEEFNRMTPTVGGGIQVVRNHLMKFIGDMDQVMGISRTLAGALLFVGEHFEKLAILTVIAGVAIATWFGASAIGSYVGPLLALQRALGGTSTMMGLLAVASKAAQGAMRGFTAALVANPIGAVAVGLALAIGALVAFGDEWKVTKDKSVSFLDVVMAGLSFLMDGIRFVGGVLSDVWAVATGAAAASWDSLAGVIGGVLSWVVEKVRQVANLFIGSWVFAVKAVGIAWEGLVPALADIGVQAINGLIGLVQAGVNKIVGIINELPGVEIKLAEFGRLNNENAGAARALGRNLAQASAESYQDYVTPAVGFVWESLLNRARRNNSVAGGGGALGTGGDGTAPGGEDEKDKASSGQTRAEYLGEVARSTQNAIDLTRIYDAELRAVRAEMVGISDHLADNDWAPLTSEERTLFEDRLTLMNEENEVARIRDDLYSRLAGSEREYGRGVRAVNDLLAEGVITTQQAERELRDLRYTALAMNTDVTSGLERGMIATMDELEDAAYRVERAYVSAWQSANSGMLDLQARTTALTTLMANDPINSGHYAMQLQKIGLEAMNLRLQLGQGDVFDTMKVGLLNLVSDFEGVLPGLTDAWTGFFGSFADGFAQSVGQAIVYSKDLGDALGEVARSALAELISALVKLGIQWLVMQVMGQGAQAAVAATGVAAGAATAAAWAPAAAAVSLATFGANAGPAMAGIATTYGLTSALSIIPGFKDGGFTGAKGTSEVAGVVHGQEFVVNAPATRQWRSVLEAMNAGRQPTGFKAGGFAGPVSAGSSAALGGSELRVVVEDHVGARFEVERVSRDEVRVIAREAVRETAPGVVAGELAKPNSKVSKALGRNTKTERKR